LAAALPEPLRGRRLVTADAAEAERFLGAAIERGHEGVMVKALDAPYEARRRGGSWLKVKRAHTLDLVVLAAEWGQGRRQGRRRTHPPARHGEQNAAGDTTNWFAVGHVEAEAQHRKGDAFAATHGTGAGGGSRPKPPRAA